MHRLKTVRKATHWMQNATVVNNFKELMGVLLVFLNAVRVDLRLVAMSSLLCSTLSLSKLSCWLPLYNFSTTLREALRSGSKCISLSIYSYSKLRATITCT